MSWRGSVLGVMVLALLVGCADSDGSGTTQVGSEDPAAASNSYSSEVDGISVSWPEGWHRAEEPLDGGRLTNSVELIALATFDGAEAGQCAPDPDGAMADMESNDALLILRASDGSGDPRPPRPQDLLAATSSVATGGCYPEGVEAWRMQFQEHGRPYEALVAAKSPLSDERRSEIEEIWDGLRMTPIDDGRDAEIGRPYWHSLYTHCGIKATTFDGREWVAEPPVSDGQGNPPPGWANPNEHGTMELKDENTAVFTSRDGERSASFRPRTAEDPPRQICQ